MSNRHGRPPLIFDMALVDVATWTAEPVSSVADVARLTRASYGQIIPAVHERTSGKLTAYYVLVPTQLAVDLHDVGVRRQILQRINK
jgi:hypothetical protein